MTTRWQNRVIELSYFNNVNREQQFKINGNMLDFFF